MFFLFVIPQGPTVAFVIAVLIFPNPPQKIVIPTEAADGLIVRCAVEGPPHLAFACSLHQTSQITVNEDHPQPCQPPNPQNLRES
jgi:hypothetical protein